jgi:signal transduction histidine kinase
LLTFINAQQYQTLERRLAEMTAIRQVVQVVNQRLEMESLLEEVVQQVGDVLGYPIVEIYLVMEDSLVLGAARGGLMDTDSRYSLDAGIVGQAVKNGQAVFVPDVEQEPAYIAAWEDTATEIAVPILKEDVIIGVLNVESPEKGSLTQEDANLLSLLADQLSVAIENAALYQRLQVHADELEAQVVERTARLEVALDQARAAEKLKTQFVSDVSHELRTPLSNIRLYLDLLADGPTERYERYLETLSRETDRLVALIEDLLTISRLDTGSVILNIRALDLNELALALVEDRQQLFREKEINLQVDLDEDLPDVAADERMISQVLGNLMTNAMHYTPSGGSVRISTIGPGMEGVSYATLIVEDTGLGIPEDEQDRIFERFYRGTASREVGSPGTGLGLAICKEILTQHGGTIRFNSQLNEGTQFTIEIPLYTEDPSTE